MSLKLSSFLADLVSDHERMSRFLAAPHDVLAEADLTDDQKAAVLSRDSRRVAAAMGAVSNSNGNVQQLTVGVWGVLIRHGENVTIGNVQNVSIGNVQNVVPAPMARSRKRPAKKPAKKPRSKNR